MVFCLCLNQKKLIDLPAFFWWGGEETGTHYVAQADLKLVVLLLQPPKCWDYSMYHRSLFGTISHTNSIHNFMFLISVHF
jgi:hypothetical protein